MVVRNSKLLGCAEKKRMPPWPQQVRDGLDGVRHFSDRPAVARRAPGNLQSPNIVWRVRGEVLDSSVETRSSGVEVARTYHITAFAVVQSEVRFERLQQSYHAHFNRDRGTAHALSNNALRDLHGSKS